MDLKIFTWCSKLERRVSTNTCISCTNRKCSNKPKKEVKTLILEKQEKERDMYIGKNKQGVLHEITIQDFKNPTEVELDNIVEVYVIKDSYRPLLKITLEQIKENKDGQQQQPTNSTKIPRKRKTSKGSQSEMGTF